MIVCPSLLVESTLAQLREAGKRRRECVVLWLARRTSDELAVQEVYRPLHTAQSDMFHIPPHGMAALHAQLRTSRSMVAAQVHSHPHHAFHSEADDRWAIVRHAGALSLVLPNFVLKTTRASFLNDVKVYRFSASAQWSAVPRADLELSCLRIS